MCLIIKKDPFYYYSTVLKITLEEQTYRIEVYGNNIKLTSLHIYLKKVSGNVFVRSRTIKMGFSSRAAGEEKASADVRLHHIRRRWWDEGFVERTETSALLQLPALQRAEIEGPWSDDNEVMVTGINGTSRRTKTGNGPVTAIKDVLIQYDFCKLYFTCSFYFGRLL